MKDKMVQRIKLFRSPSSFNSSTIFNKSITDNQSVDFPFKIDNDNLDLDIDCNSDEHRNINQFNSINPNNNSEEKNQENEIITNNNLINIYKNQDTQNNKKSFNFLKNMQDKKFNYPSCRVIGCNGILKIKINENFSIDYECEENRNHAEKKIHPKIFEKFYLKENKLDLCQKCNVSLLRN